MQRSKQLLIFLLIIGFLAGHTSRLLWPGTIYSRVNLLDILVLVAVVWVALLRKRWPLPHRWLAVWLALVASSFFIGLTIFGLGNQPESLLFIVRLAIYGLFFGVAYDLFGDFRWRLVESLGVLLSLLGLIQLWVWPAIPVSFIASHGFDPHAGRLFATFFDPNFVGSLLVVTILATAAQMKKQYTHADLLALLIQLMAIYLTQSRSAWLALIVGAVLFIVAIDKKYLLLIISLALMAFLFSPSLANRIRSAVSLDDTSRARLDSWQTAGLVIEQSAITGVGYNNYSLATERLNRYYPRLGHIALAANGSDSTMLTIWATTGLFGVLSWLIFLVSLAWQERVGLDRTLAVAVVGALLVNSWFINSLLLVFVLFLMAVLLPSQVSYKK